ncbi:hypothetical protein [Mycobacterium sp. DL99]|uniref:hypothetical protein n=1 Tax=Mycobacterium sp. DL99 TaxID=2528957 RepID=UPI001081B035|nr:hypothetical protein [Mycobacterium sp. DL99]
MSMDWIPTAALILTPILSCVGIVVGALIGRRAGLRQADAAVHGAQASARQAVTADWKAFSDSLQARLGAVETRSSASEARLDAAEVRASAAEARAAHAESLYKAALSYLREVASWFSSRWPGEVMPAPPTELENELRD